MKLCRKRTEIIEFFVQYSDEPIPLFDETPVLELVDDIFDGYSESDGKDYLFAWELREIEEDNNQRCPVGIEADVLKFDWMELARI